jgi:hypothetical protein
MRASGAHITQCRQWRMPEHVASYSRFEGDAVLAWFSSWHICPVDTHEV